MVSIGSQLLAALGLLPVAVSAVRGGLRSVSLQAGFTEQTGWTTKISKDELGILQDSWTSAPWLAAVLLCVLASFLDVCGFALQKIGASAEGKHCRVAGLVLSPKWILGFSLMLLGSGPVMFLANSLAPLSTTAPLGCMTLAVNMALAPLLLGERAQPGPALPARALIIAGTVFTASAGVHRDDGHPASFAELAFRPQVAWLVAALLALGAACSVRVRQRAHRHEELGPKPQEAVVAAVAAASASAVVRVGLQALGLLLSENATVLQMLVCLGAMLVPGLMQLLSLNWGLQRHPQMLFLPLYSAFSVILATAGSLVFYDEFASLSEARCVTMFIGVSANLGGVALLAAQPQRGEPLAKRLGGFAETG